MLMLLAEVRFTRLLSSSSAKANFTSAWQSSKVPSTSSAVMAYFGHNDGRFVFHNESTQSIGLQVNGYNAENGLLVYSDKVAFVNNVEVTGSLNVVGSITGSLFGTASWSLNTLNPFTFIATGSVTASVNIANDIFLIKSSSSSASFCN